MKLVKFITIFFIILFSFSTQADECKKFNEKVLSIPIPDDGLVTDGQQSRNDLGLFFHKNYRFEKNDIKINRNKDNYPIIKISFLEDAIPHKSPIISINGIDLSNQTDEQILGLNNSNFALVKTLDNSYNIIAKEYDLYPFDLEYFTINAIDEIKTKEGEFLVDYNFQVSHERPDWIEAGREIGNFTICPVDDLINSTQIYSPVTYEPGSILKQIGFDQDKSFGTYDQVYYEKFDKTFTRSTLSGVARIKADFDLKKFPFDTQILKLELMPPYPIEFNDENIYPKPYISVFNPRKNVFIDLEKYKNFNYLKEWRIESVSVDNEIDVQSNISQFDRENLVLSIYDKINISIKVDRNTNYFVFKIIIPVFLILAIAWSVMWIPPNQVESRLTTSIVALLALIAYNFVFNEDLPKLSYLTSLDRYILLSYLFCAIPTFLTIYFSRLTKKDYNIALSVNKKSRLLGIIIYGITTTVIFSV